MARAGGKRGWALAVAFGLVCALALSACDSETAVEVAGDGPGGVEPGAGSDYSGPLHVPPGDRSRWEKRAGVAGRVVQCHNRGRRGISEPAGRHGGAVAKDIDKAISVAASEGFFIGPTDGVTMVRKERERALFVYEVDGQTLQAFVVDHGRSMGERHQLGWYVKSWARCDWSEFPDSAIMWAIQVWSDDDGNRVSTKAIQSYPGPQHCSWEDMTFLEYRGHSYVRDPVPYLMEDYFAQEYVADMPLPDDAVDTGYHRGDDHLWLSPDEKRAYVGDEDSVELWPRTIKHLGCA